MKNEVVIKLIRDFVVQYTRKQKTHTTWEEPLMGFANANDPLFLELKKVVDASHRLPQDILKKANSVISYFIPFKKETIQSNVLGKFSSRDWALAYIETNKLIKTINQYLHLKLEDSMSEKALIPATHNFDEILLISDWSHKHVAFIAGLGNFGLHKMLITDKGCCGRFGSLVTSIKFKPTQRKDTPYCLYFYDKTCTKCIQNCMFDVLKMDSFDRKAYYDICLKNKDKYKELGVADVCGKCVSLVPCSIQNPVKNK